MKAPAMATESGNPRKVVVRWRTRNPESIRLIRERFGMPTYTTLNGHTPAYLCPEDKTVFEDTAKMGYFSFRYVDWTFNGVTYSW